MKIIILTSIRRGTASEVLPELCKHKDIHISKVVLAHGGNPNRMRRIKRILLKILKIGFLGALNGIRIRDWYSSKNVEDIHSVCNSLNVELVETPFINCDRTREIFAEASTDLGLSLGNGYIPKSVFSIPKYGMVNIHAEILPDFQGAQSIIWPIYEGLKITGFTIHQIDRNIDTGDILLQEKYPIEFHPTLRKTVVKNLISARMKIPESMSFVCQNYTSLKAEAVPQSAGKSYTTPSIWQFFRMLRNNRKMYNQSFSKNSDIN